LAGVPNESTVKRSHLVDGGGGGLQDTTSSASIGSVRIERATVHLSLRFTHQGKTGCRAAPKMEA
jgi:hypothetical protein